MPTPTRAALQFSVLAQIPVLAACLLVLVAGFFIYGATGHDDSHITFWAAHTLANNGNITNYNGEYVQQSSSLLLTLLLAAIHWLCGADIPAIGYVTGILASLATCALLLKTVHAVTTLHPASNTVLLLSALLPLSAASFLLWTYSGMESTLTALCLLACIYSWWQLIESDGQQKPPTVLVMLTTTALVLVRPEMPLILPALAIFNVFFHRADAQRRRRSLQLVAISTVTAIALFSWQKFYFGSWLPLPATAKQSGSFLVHWRSGYLYLLINCVLNPVLPLSLLSAVTLWWQQRKATSALTSLLALAGGVVAIYCGFIIASGGDWMQAGRFVVPVLPVAALLVTSLLAQIPQHWLACSALAALLSLQTGLQYPVVSQLSHGIPVWAQYRLASKHQHYSQFEKLNQEHLRDMAAIDHLASIIPALHEKLGRPVVLMSGQAGMVFYYTAQRFGNNVSFRDLRGLVEGSLTLCPASFPIQRAQQGLFWGYREFFELLPALQKECGITAPDIIYDINDMNQKMGKTLEPLGYTMIHQESGFPLENNSALPYKRLLAPNMIFVRTDWLPLLGNPEKRITNYRDLPLHNRWPMKLDDEP
jgi:hypothetical protein